MFVTLVVVFGALAVAVHFFFRNQEPVHLPSYSLDTLTETSRPAHARIDRVQLDRFTEFHELPKLPDLTNYSARAIGDFHGGLTRIESAPKDAEAFGELGRVFQSHGLPGEALQCYDRAAQLVPNDYRWAYYIGRIHADRYESEQAIAAYERSAELDASYAPTFLALGTLYLQAGSRKFATQAFQRLVELRPNSTHGHFGLAQIAFDNEDFESAARIASAAVQQDPNDFRLRTLLARAYQQLGQDGLAKQQFAVIKHLDDQSDVKKQIVFDDPLYHEVLAANTTDAALKERQRAAIGTNQNAIAIRLAQELCRRNPRDAALRQLLANAYKAAKNYKQALVHAEESVQLDGQLLEAHATKAQLLLILRRTPEALKTLDWVVQHDADSYTGQYYRGAAQVLSNQYEAAIDSFRKAVAIQPRSARAHVGLAEALTMAGRTPEAMAAYRQALQLDPTNQRARRALQRNRTP